MAVLDGYGAIVVDGLGSTKEEEEEDGKMGEGGRVWVGRSVPSEESTRGRKEKKRRRTRNRDAI